MIRLFVRHPVRDYEDWKARYDDFDRERREMGVRQHGVYRSVADPNDVTVFHDFDTHQRAQDFAESARLREVMGEAGVQGEPALWFTSPA